MNQVSFSRYSAVFWQSNSAWISLALEALYSASFWTMFTWLERFSLCAVTPRARVKKHPWPRPGVPGITTAAFTSHVSHDVIVFLGDQRATSRHSWNISVVSPIKYSPLLYLKHSYTFRNPNPYVWKLEEHKKPFQYNL